MDTSDKKKVRKSNLSQEAIAQIRLEIHYFFLNYPEAEVKKNLWQLFKGWAYNISEGGGSGEIADMLLFYEQLHDIIELMVKL